MIAVHHSTNKAKVTSFGFMASLDSWQPVPSQAGCKICNIPSAVTWTRAMSKDGKENSYFQTHSGFLDTLMF